MINYESLDLDPRVFLAALLENLNTRFFADERVHSKRLVKRLLSNLPVNFMQIGSGNTTDVSCHLVLDHSHYQGKLGFGKFRESLAVMMRSIAQKLHDKEELNIMIDEVGDIIFNIPGVVESDEGINILITGLSQNEAGKATINLMFMNPESFGKSKVDVIHS